MSERANTHTQQKVRDRSLFLAIASLLVVGVTDDKTWAQRWRESPREAAAIGLTLQVRDADGPTLSMGGAIDRTGKYLRPVPIELGKISAGHDAKRQGKEAAGVTTTMTFADGKSSFRVSTSRLTPAVLLEVKGAQMSFFGAPGRVPKRWALPRADSRIRTGRFNQASPPPGAMQHGWMLVWYGADTHFESTKWPMIDWKVKASGPRYPWWPLEKELSGEVNRLLEAGHLAPLFYTFVSADESVRAVQSTRYWNDPSEQLYLLADLLDVLPEDEREMLLDYMRRERQAFPPENVARLDSADGTRRERFTVVRGKQWVAANDRNSHKSDEFRAQDTSSLYRAYGLSRYYQAIGKTPGPAALSFARSALDDSLRDRQWDTLGWSARKYSHQYRLLRESLRLQVTVQCVNRDLAGTLGYLRLCDLARKSAEDDAWAHFARLAVLRFALGKYAHYQGRTGLVELPRNPEAAKQLLEIADFRNPVNFFHQVREFVPEGVSLSNGAVPPEPVTFGSHLMVYRELVPETARLLANWGMGPETIVYLDHYTARNGTWYALFSDAIDGRETPWLFLADVHQLFLAHAWIGKTDPNTLVRFVDVPYAKVGDLFHMHKLAETIKAIRGMEYK